MFDQNRAKDGYFVLARDVVGRITNVSSHSQNTNSKKCISCRRALNYEFFGESRQSKDGFNSYCRGCRNQKRRIHYGRSNETYLLNLNESNKARLNKLYNLDGIDIDLRALCLNHSETLKVRIKINDILVLFHIIDANENTVLKFELLIQIDHTKSLQLIKRIILDELLNRSLRIIESEEEKFKLSFP